MLGKINKRFLINQSFTGSAFCCLALLVLCLLPVSEIQAQKDTISAIQKDSRNIIPRYPSRASMEEILNNSDYQYKDDPEPPENPLLRWFFDLWKKFQSLFSGKSYENFWQYALMAAAVGLVLFVLYKARVLDYIFPSREKNGTQDYVIGSENIHEMNLDQALDEALSLGDFRLAIRLQYLKTLKLLSVRELINWQPNRTNQRYLQDLAKHPQLAEFARITRYFEFAWYGDFRIGEVEYEEMKTFSAAFNNTLNQRSYV